MKIIRILLCAASVLALAAGCNKNPQEDLPFGMKLSPDTLFFEQSPAAAQTVKVTSSKMWKAKNYPDWVMLSQNGSDVRDVVFPVGESSVDVMLTPNMGYERDTLVLFNGGTLAKKALVICQKGAKSYTTVAELKSLLGENESVTIQGETIVKAVVVSNPSLNNQTSNKNYVVQDNTAGIAVRFSDTPSLTFGDEVKLNLEGQTLTKYNNAFQINSLPVAKATKVRSGVAVEPIVADIKDFLDNKYESRYIALNDVQVAASDTLKTWVMGGSHTSINFMSKSGDSFVVFSSSYSSFGSASVPKGSGTLKGVANINNTTVQMMFAQLSDMEGLVNPRFKIEEKLITIDEVFAAGKGYVTTQGKVVGLGTKGFIINDGGSKNFYVYTNEKTNISKGRSAKVSGTLTTYGKVLELSSPAVDSTITAQFPDPAAQAPIDLTDPAKAVAYEGDGSCTLVKIGGKLSKSGENFNLAFTGKSVKGSVQSADIDMTQYVDKDIEVVGYFIGLTSNYFTVIPQKVYVGKAPYIKLSPESQDVTCDVKKARIVVSTNVGQWTANADNGATVSIDKDTVFVSFQENTDTIPKLYNVTVTSSDGEIVATAKVNQGRKYAGESKILTTKEITDAIAELMKTSSSKYQALTISSASGEWNAYSNCASGMTCIQIRAKAGSMLKSPTFAKNIKQVILHVTSDTEVSPEKTFYAVPVDRTLPTGSYTNDTYANPYGSAVLTAAGDLTITFGSDTKNFMIISKGGTVYFDAVTVVLKN